MEIVESHESGVRSRIEPPASGLAAIGPRVNNFDKKAEREFTELFTTHYCLLTIHYSPLSFPRPSLILPKDTKYACSHSAGIEGQCNH